jgi:hypothetical protein
MDIQYRSVLSNLALYWSHPEAIPNHVHLADGVVQINDRGGFGQAGGFTTFSGTDFGIDQFGPSGQRQVFEQWGTDATTDPERLYDLQSLYRVALGMDPLPPPNSITYLRQQKPSRNNKPGDSFKTSSAPPSTDMGGSSSSASDGSSGDSGRHVPLEVMITDVPAPGWYHIGCKKGCAEGCLLRRPLGRSLCLGHGRRHAATGPIHGDRASCH